MMFLGSNCFMPQSRIERCCWIVSCQFSGECGHVAWSSLVQFHRESDAWAELFTARSPQRGRSCHVH